MQAYEDFVINAYFWTLLGHFISLAESGLFPRSLLPYLHPPRATSSSAATLVHIAVISPFLDRSHGTERCIVEQLERFAVEPGAEIHIYAQRVQDLRGVTPCKYRMPARPDRDDADKSNRLFWHKVPAIPGPHLLQYIFWFFANRICRWRDAAFHNAKYDLLYSAGINATDADAISVHVVFHEFYRQVLPQLDFPCRSPLTVHWPRLAHRRAYYRLIMALEKRIYRRATTSLSAISASAAALLQKYFHPADNRVIRYGVDAQSFSVLRRLVLLAERGTARKQFNLSTAKISRCC